MTVCSNLKFDIFQVRRRSKIAQMTAKRSHWAVSRFHSRSFKIFGQYLISSSTLSCCFCNSTHFIWRSHASVSRLYRPSFLSRANVSGVISLICKSRDTVGSFSFIFRSASVCDLRSLAVYKSTMRAKFWINRTKTLHKPMNKRSTAFVVGTFESHIAHVVRLSTSSQPGLITWPT